MRTRTLRPSGLHRIWTWLKFRKPLPSQPPITALCQEYKRATPIPLAKFAVIAPVREDADGPPTLPLRGGR